MATSTSALAAPPATAAFLHVAANLGRLAILLAILIVLVVMRTEASLLVNLGLTAGAVVGLFLVFGQAAGMQALILYLIGFGLFDQLRAFADNTGVVARFDYVIDIERALFGSVPSAWLQERLYTPGRAGLLDLATSTVYVSYFVLVHAFALLVWLKDRERFARFAGALMLTFYAGLLVCFLLPTAPPWLAADQGHLGTVHRVFQELAGDGSYTQGARVAGINDVAAMPSLHLAITVVVALMASRYGRRWGALGGLYALAMAFSLTYLGEHYVVDSLAGAACALGAWAIAGRIWAREDVEGAVVEEPGVLEPAPKRLAA